MTDNLLSDVTPIAPGTWVGIGFFQNVVGAFNFSVTWAQLAGQWVGFLPDNFPQARLCINDTLNQKNAVIEVQVMANTTVGELASIAAAISPDVSIRAVYVNGPSRLTAAQWEQQCSENELAINKCLSDPVACAKQALGVVAVVVALAIVAIIGLRKAAGAKTWV